MVGSGYLRWSIHNKIIGFTLLQKTVHPKVSIVAIVIAISNLVVFLIVEPDYGVTGAVVTFNRVNAGCGRDEFEITVGLRGRDGDRKGRPVREYDGIFEAISFRKGRGDTRDNSSGVDDTGRLVCRKNWNDANAEDQRSGQHQNVYSFATNRIPPFVWL